MAACPDGVRPPLGSEDAALCPDGCAPFPRVARPSSAVAQASAGLRISRYRQTGVPAGGFGFCYPHRLSQKTVVPR